MEKKKIQIRSTIFIIVVLSQMIFLGCSSESDNYKAISHSHIKIEADLLNSKNDASRYSGNSYSNLSFIDGDAICMFVNGEQPNKWTLNNDTWEPTSIILWPDTTNIHNFHAFYPYNDECTFDSIFAAPLCEQDGSLENLYKYDLLITNKSINYKDSKGIVSFTGDEYSFKHALSLLKINIKASGDLNQATIKSIKLSCPYLFSRVIYSFRQKNFYFDTSKSIEYISITLNHNMNGVSKELFLITSPKESKSDVELSIEYSTSESSNIIKTTTLSDISLNSGQINQYNIMIKDGNIEIESPTIIDWDDNNPSNDIYI